MRKFIVTPYSNKEHLSLVTNSDILDLIYEKYNLPVKNYYLRNSEIKKDTGEESLVSLFL